MILIDTSAWVEFLRGTGSPVCEQVDSLLASDLATCHPVRMEVLAGASSGRHLDDLRSLLARASLLPTVPADYEEAAALFRTCRAGGETVRRLMDCLIASHAIRHAIPILHAGKDFDVLSRHTPLQVAI